MSGGEALAKSLVREGVEVVFGIPGIQIYGIVAALRDEPGIRMVTTRHEQAATYMADGYARASGKPGVALVVPGAGLYNAAPGLTNAYSRSTPVLLIAGQIPRGAIGKNLGAVHEIADQPGTVRSVTKWQRQASRPREVPDAVFEAFRQMRTGRPRPVLIEMPPEAGVEREEVALRSPAPYLPNCAQPGRPSGGRSGHRRISYAPDIRRRRSRALRCGTSPRRAGRGDKHTSGYVQQWQGDHSGQPSTVLWLLFQPSWRATGDEPALRCNAGRRRGDRNRHALLPGQSGGRGVYLGEHQHRRRGSHEGPSPTPFPCMEMPRRPSRPCCPTSSRPGPRSVRRQPRRSPQPAAS
jgi:sulfopyruvate decarboxylase TPP-binding subunit